MTTPAFNVITPTPASRARSNRNADSSITITVTPAPEDATESTPHQSAVHYLNMIEQQRSLLLEAFISQSHALQRQRAVAELVWSSPNAEDRFPEIYATFSVMQMLELAVEQYGRDFENLGYLCEEIWGYIMVPGDEGDVGL